MEALAWIYFIGVFVSIFVYSGRAAGGNPAAMGLMMRESFFRGYVWVIATMLSIIGWPVVLVLWLLADKPPPPTLFGPAAAEAMGMSPGQHQGLGTKFVVRPRFRLLERALHASSERRPAGQEVASANRATRDEVFASQDDLIEWLKKFGRESAFDSVDWNEVGPTVAALHHRWVDSPEQFVDYLATHALPVGGWAVYGAHTIAWEILTDPPHTDRYIELFRTAMAFARSEGIERRMGEIDLLLDLEDGDSEA